MVRNRKDGWKLASPAGRHNVHDDDADLLPGLNVRVGLGDRPERIVSIDDRANWPASMRDLRNSTNVWPLPRGAAIVFLAHA